MIQLWKIVFYESKQSEFIEETMMDKKTQKIGVICSIVQIILSIICLIYNAINQENIIIWVLFLCSGILLLSSNISSGRAPKRQNGHRELNLFKHPMEITKV